jgi:aerotaxis receptor
MKSNLQRQEFKFPTGQTMVSVTDLKGRVAFCNHPLIEARGYSYAEMLGRPHNLVRHPAMPEETFRDMWATIQAKFPWTSRIKNRRKNGDHYWVQANATPIPEGEQITGYLSVRSAPFAQAVAGARRLYPQMRQENRPGQLTIALKHGQDIRTGLLGSLIGLLQPEIMACSLGYGSSLTGWYLARWPPVFRCHWSLMA